MKVTNSSQSVLLPRAIDALSAEPGDLGSPTSSGQSVLERLTILSAQPDHVVYVRADFASATPSVERSVDASVVATVPKRSAPATAPVLVPADDDPLQAIAAAAALLPVVTEGATRSDIDGNPRGTARGVGLSSYLKPVEQYALTQRLGDNRRALNRIDEHA